MMFLSSEILRIFSIGIMFLELIDIIYSRN